tara:strand:- start:544 stop:891 length:348 start_codon:yes stop_codon:yes gene_type:complete
MSQLFQTNIQNWVNIDNKIKNLQQELKNLRSERHTTADSIFTYVETNNLENAIVQISDGKLKFQNVKSTSPLTFKFIEECLNECMKDENQVKQLIKFIKQKRTFQYNYDIKRSYK